MTSLLPNEAVHAAKAQGPVAAERLDMALRLAFWRDSRCISMRHEILDVADGCEGVDVDALREAIDDGRARGPAPGSSSWTPTTRTSTTAWSRRAAGQG